VKTVYLGLGSNLGDRRANLQKALEALEAPDLRIARVSPIYETEPMDVRDQPWFLNLAVEAETTLLPLQLLRRVLATERRLGRRRSTPKGPRNIDIDILYYGGVIVDAPGLSIPHPRLHERRFVLAPLANLAPEFRDPRTRRTVRELLDAVPAGQAIRRVDPPQKEKPPAG
jgi:2-amino-4-hydroxy-6-hydroxymethyldihydropteridine diphosphokinase